MERSLVRPYYRNNKCIEPKIDNMYLIGGYPPSFILFMFTITRIIIITVVWVKDLHAHTSPQRSQLLNLQRIWRQTLL